MFAESGELFVVVAGLVRTALSMAIVGTLLSGIGILALPSLVRSVSVWDDLNIVSITSRLGVRLQSVTVHGRQKTSASDLLSILNVVHGQPLLSLDIRDLQSRIESLVWVRSATINRYFPDRLHINLVEHMPIALWQDGDIFKPVDADGRLIDVPSSPDTHLLFVAGPELPGLRVIFW